MLTIILSICAVILAGLMAVVVYSNYHKAANIWLAAFMGSGLLWLLANLLANIASSPEANLLFSRSALVGASLIPLTFIVFCIQFTARKPKKFIRALLYIPIFGVIATTPTSWNIKSISLESGVFEPGISYFILLGIIVVYLSIGAGLLIEDAIHGSRQRREQLRYILVGILLTAIPAITMSAILPLRGYSGAVPFAPSVVIIFAVFTTIAIVKHRLFGIRFYVFRAIAYLTALLSIAVIYIAPAVYVMAIFIMGFPFVLSKFAAGVLFATIIAVYFDRIRAWFNKNTNRIFFRDAYDPQQFIADFNKAIVSTLDLETMLQTSAQVVASNLKAEYCVIGLRGANNDSPRIIGTIHKSFTDKDVQKMRKLLPTVHARILITNNLDGRRIPLTQVLRKNDIALLGRLGRQSDPTSERLGYIMLGDKKNGTAYTKQDLRILDTVINGLIVAVQNSLRFEEIQNFNITLQKRVDDATAQLRRTNAKLVALDESKDDFISMASHQLRTPLTAIKGYLSMVLDGDGGKVTPVQRKMVNQAFISSQRMVFLIADLLNVSRLKTGKFEIERSTVDLDKLIKQEIGQLRETAAAKSQTLDYQAAKDFPLLRLDETKTRQVIMNFVDNALHYTPSGGHVSVELVNRQHSVELRVKDDGIGVPKLEQHHLFTKFYRAVNARRERPDGTGLGLFMAKKVIVAQGGAVIFTSRENVGSTFGFSLPKEKLVVTPTPASTPHPAPRPA